MDVTHLYTRAPAPMDASVKLVRERRERYSHLVREASLIPIRRDLGSCVTHFPGRHQPSYPRLGQNLPLMAKPASPTSEFRYKIMALLR
eukprot:scaffold2417_cov174-Isochrysis_galbana.AAC.5